MTDTYRERGTDQRVDLVLECLELKAGETTPGGTPLTMSNLRSRLVWDEALNAAVIRNRADPDEFRMFVTHSTFQPPEGGTLEPDLSFDERDERFRTRTSNVYGTGFYVANRPEAAMRSRNDPQRTLGAFVTAPLTYSEVRDARRELPSEILHLGSMMLTEVAPKVLDKTKLFGGENERKVARYLANRADHRMVREKVAALLLNEAPRFRSEKLDDEADWRYDLIPPQYMLIRTEMLRVGTYLEPAEPPRKLGALSLYGRGFWQAAWRNGRDTKRLRAAREAQPETKDLVATWKG